MSTATEVVTIESLASPELVDRAAAALALAEEIKPLAGAVILELEAAYVPRAQSLVIDSDATFERASVILRELAQLKADVEAKRKALKDPVFQGGKGIDATFAAIATPLVEADRILRGKVGAYLAEQQRAREEAERKAREEAERLREEAALAAAEEAERTGASPEEVDAVLDDAMAAPAAVALPAVAPPNTGVFGRKTWSAEVTDMRKFVAACLAGSDGAGLFLLVPDASKLAQLARAHDGRLSIPGVSVTAGQTLAVRR